MKKLAPLPLHRQHLKLGLVRRHHTLPCLRPCSLAFRISCEQRLDRSPERKCGPSYSKSNYIISVVYIILQALTQIGKLRGRGSVHY
ncbi:hypothetical protein VNO77_34009 [Canavalia gladiata]|uniref:Uncharacterized protein n=1 Tax=Canavalia gladiata TaxID=3824 RepID=A0AAN9KFI2_CANGL